MAEHELKTWTTVYPDIAEGLKSFDIRPNDRDFHVDDVLVLREYDPILGTYTGRSCVRRVTYVLAGGFGLRDGYVAMGIARWKPNYLTLDQIDGDEFNGVKVGQLGESDDVFAFTHAQEKAIDAARGLFDSTGDQIHKITVIEVKWWRVVDNCGCGDTCPHKPDEDGETEHDTCMHWGLPPCTEAVLTWLGLTCEAGDVGALPVIVMEVELR